MTNAQSSVIPVISAKMSGMRSGWDILISSMRHYG